MDRLIPILNKLQEVFNALGSDPLDLPQIVVVGSQSSGKSSVLESIVGRDFLPRGSGIVTRRPLILQLIHLPPEVKSNENNQDGPEWGEFQHKPNEMFYDFDKIREEIERETDRLTGKNKGISDVPIMLKVYSPYVLNLSLVDLPGITRVPVGDQPPDIEKQIRAMIRRYIDKPNTLILAITAANTDLTNSDALQMARDSDPEGERTLGVITKIDIMDKGTDAVDMLMGRIVPLKLGFVGVICRSQQDIITKKPIREALKHEVEFFSTHPLYRNMASRCGITYLSKTLNRILIQHIRDCLPELKLKVNKMLADAQMEIMTYGDPLYDTKNSQGALLLQIITKFCADFRDAIDGKLTELSVNELYGGARINFIFNEIFGKCLDFLNPTEGLGTNDIRTAIKNATGPKAALFIPEASFELLVKGQITRLEEPSIQCVELVYDELQRIVSQLETKELLRFAQLREQVVEVVNNLLNKYKTPTKAMISSLIEIELAFINTNHPDFVGGDGAIAAILERMNKNQNPNQNPANPPPPTSQLTASQGPQPQPRGHQQVPPPSVREQPQYDQSNPNQGNQGFFGMWFGASRTAPNQPPQKDSQTQGNQNMTSSQLRDSRMDPMGRGPSKSPQKLDQVPATIKPTSPLTDKENFETELIKHLLVSYFNIVRKNVKDTVPKSVMHFLVNKSKETIQNELVAALYKEDLFDELLQESPIIAQKRQACKSMIETLRKAHDILNEVRDFQVN